MPIISITTVLGSLKVGPTSCNNESPDTLSFASGFRLPPGPPGKFLVGNLYDLPPGDKPEYIKYAELAKYGEYFPVIWFKFSLSRSLGDLVYLNVLGKSMLLVNSPEMTHELFVKRGAIYSDRETTQMLHEL